jgi:L-iditol 2-dehydrogenase
VVVQGAGPIGVMHALLARVRGAARVIVSDPIAQRLTAAAAITGARTVDPVSGDLPLAVAEESGGSGADVVIVAAPSPDAQRLALELAAPGGRICFFAGLPKQNSDVSIDANLVHYKELIITGTTACSTADCRRALQLIVSGAVDLAPLISARFTLERAQDAFAAAQDRNNLKVVFEMTGHPRPVGGEQIAAHDAARSLHDA